MVRAVQFSQVRPFVLSVQDIRRHQAVLVDPFLPKKNIVKDQGWQNLPEGPEVLVVRAGRLLPVVLLDLVHQVVQLRQAVQIHPFGLLLQFDLVVQFHLLVHGNHVDRLYLVIRVVLDIRVVLVDPLDPENMLEV